MTGPEHVVPAVLRPSPAGLVPRESPGRRQPMRVTPGAFRAAGLPVPPDPRQWNAYQLSGRKGWTWTPALDRQVRSCGAELQGAGALVCIDCDVLLGEDGAVQLDGLGWLAEHAAADGHVLDLSGFVVVATPGNPARRHWPGRHIWARIEPAMPFRPGPLADCPAVELKLHATCPGTPGYEVLHEPGELAVLPSWIAAMARLRPVPVPASSHAIRSGSRYAEAAVRAERTKLRDAEQGGRNAALNRAAYALGRLVGADVLDAEEASAALLDDAEQLGLVAEDGILACRGTIRSGLAAGMARPRSVVTR